MRNAKRAKKWSGFIRINRTGSYASVYVMRKVHVWIGTIRRSHTPANRKQYLCVGSLFPPVAAHLTRFLVAGRQWRITLDCVSTLVSQTDMGSLGKHATCKTTLINIFDNGDGVTDSTVLVQFELANGILERNVSVRVATVSSNASTGIK